LTFGRRLADGEKEVRQIESEVGVVSITLCRVNVESGCPCSRTVHADRE
jgi:hypothetical protein